MKLRVLGILSLLVVVIVVTVSSVILTSASRELTQELQINRVAALNRFAQLASDALADNNTTQLQREMDRYADLYGEGILIHMQGQTIRSGNLHDDQSEVKDALGRASLNLSDTTLNPVRAFGTGNEIVSRSFGTASQVLGEVVMEVNLDAARQKLRERWLVVVLAAVALGALLLLAAARVTGWVLRPVHRLSKAVHELEATGTTSQLPEAGPPELRELSRSFTAMAHTVSESMESQRRLIADTSHQLRNPVGALRLRIDLLQLALRSEPEKAAAAGVVAELERVEGMLDGVLKLATAEHRASAGPARADQATDHQRLAVIDPFPVLQGETERAAPAALQAGATITLIEPALPVTIACNPEELAHMVGELLANAIKYAPGAHITVATEPAPGGTAVVISDDGPGLPADQRAASTTRFWRAPQHSRIPGNGLGMTIVERLAEANGAKLTLEPKEPHGLTVRLEFAHPQGGFDA
ncbi:HAMP domain-containing sensor histidine kinase [Paenarthrobacter nitroguajacolicus]|uniref:HAMP domain-containing sensor histidine kinase n=1 Tax=Paenarthrobacter nitroguajacolicus TaxID=211146 RepID=UPI00248BA02F|nr:HAMP domain-containing sensor histidine kinase [Paenarthrobacter nitroguajacolicus]MDI2033335.1 Adaptive-response sensory-kinase SasA [Paenarthrobacter nitroguajacolicus]